MTTKITHEPPLKENIIHITRYFLSARFCAHIYVFFSKLS